MISAINEVMFAMSSSLAASIAVKATFATALGLIGALLARRNRAAVRHAVLAASFGVLFALPVVSIVAPPFRIAMQVEARDGTMLLPLAGINGTMSPIAPADGRLRSANSAPRSSGFSSSALIFMVWLAGAAISLMSAIVGLWRIRSLRRSGLPWLEGQSVTDGLALDAGVHRRIEVLQHEALSGPIVCGILHPAIVAPLEAQTWEKEDLNRAIVHELEHVKRGDYMSHCLARALCAVYWFHPLVWIAWRQLRLEAERACDDAVLRHSEATEYADQLVGLARRLSKATKSPLLAMANRADLATRVRAVLDNRQRRGRAGAIPVALACATAAVIVLTVSPLRAVAQPQSPPHPPEYKYDVVSIRASKPGPQASGINPGPQGGVRAQAVTVAQMLTYAYGVRNVQIVGGPLWIRSDRFDVAFTPDRTETTPESGMARQPDGSLSRNRQRMQAVLRDRFALSLRSETRDLPIYRLTVSGNGHKLAVPRTAGLDPEISANRKQITATNATMKMLADVLSTLLDGYVTDETGLEAAFDFKLEWTADASVQIPGKFPPPGEPINAADAGGTSIFNAVREQLGLRLQSKKGPVPVLVVEKIEKPGQN